MANYFVGDIQGCFLELQRLLEKVDFHPSRDCLWAVGDLVARGPGSLETLRFFRSLCGSARVALGNHDLHLLATNGRLKRVNPKDQLAPLFEARDLDSLIDWLRRQPLYQELPKHNIIMTHAGVPPQWDLATLKHQADAVGDALSSADYLTDLIAKMYTDAVDSWHQDLTPTNKLIYCINALTRMRYLYPDGRMDFDCKTPPKDCPNPELSPWFQHPSVLRPRHTLVFGHWAAIMGRVNSDSLQALDTGCCWGEHMTLWHLESNQKITQKRLKRS